jgi:uncharacterized protein (TIRG00374 family)
MRMAKRALRIGLSLALAAVLVVFFLRNVNLAEVGRTLKDARSSFILASVLVTLAAYWIRTVRWQLILRSAGPTRHTSALLAVAVGYAAMALLPARAGDIIRPLALAKRDRIAAPAALASMITERLFDLLTVILFFLFFTLWPPTMVALNENTLSSLEILRASGYAIGAGLALAVALMLCLFRYQESFVEIATRPLAWVRPSWKDPFATVLGHVLDGLRVLHKPRDLLLTTVISLILWYVIYWQVQFALLAFDLHMPLRATFLLVTLAVIGLAIPTPAGVGGFHKATQMGLTAFFGVELNRATGVAIAYHAISFVPITVIGLACLPLLGVSLKEVRAPGPDVEEGASS